MEWLSSVGVNKLVQKKFSYHDVDGQLLLEVNEDDLKEDLLMQRKQDRSRCIAAIRSLKAKHEYENDDSSGTSSSGDSETDDSRVVCLGRTLDSPHGLTLTITLTYRLCTPCCTNPSVVYIHIGSDTIFVLSFNSQSY